MQSNNNNSEKIKNYSITLFCVVAIFFLIFYAIYLNNKIKAQQDLITKFEKTTKEITKEVTTEISLSLDKLSLNLNKLSLNVNKVYDDYKFAMDQQRELQLTIKENAENVGQVINGITTIISARFMEDQDIISQTDADLLVFDNILKIKQSNPSLAELVSLLNKTYIKNRR